MQLLDRYKRFDVTAYNKICTHSRAEEDIKPLQNFEKNLHKQMSGGYPANVETVNHGMAALVVAPPVNPLTAQLNDTYGYPTNGADGLLRYHEFKAKLPNVFNFNKEVGCIFSAKFNTIEVGNFIGELYLSYILTFKANPPQLNATNSNELHMAIFNPTNQYMWFKAYILCPNLKHNGPYQFPNDIGIKLVVAENWLKR